MVKHRVTCHVTSANYNVSTVSLKHVGGKIIMIVNDFIIGHLSVFIERCNVPFALTEPSTGADTDYR